MLITLLTAVGMTLSMVFVWPQTVRILRSGRIDGVSPGTWTLSILMFGAWGGYAISIGYWPLILANTSCMIAATLIFIFGTRLGWPLWWAGLCVLVLVLCALAVLYAPLVLAAAMAGTGLVMRIPQFVKLLRAPSVEGVSTPTWWISAVNSGVWIVIGLERSSVPLVLASGIGLVTSLAMLALLYRRREPATALAESNAA